MKSYRSEKKNTLVVENVTHIEEKSFESPPKLFSTLFTCKVPINNSLSMKNKAVLFSK